MNRLEDYLRHIIEAADRIASYIADLDEAGFMRTTLVQDAVIRNIENIGEASRNIRRLSVDFADQHGNLRLNDAYRMRNAISHGYFNVDLQVVWDTITNDIPKLRLNVAAILEKAP